MAGTALNAFNDFVTATGSTYVTGTKDLINNASKNTYWLGRLIKGGSSANKKVLRGGSTIKASTFFKGNGTGEFYQPGANHSWQNPQRLKEIETYWRFSMVHMSWVEQEILLNDIINYGTADAKYHQFTDIRNEKEALMWTEKWDLLDGRTFAKPDSSTMEGQGASLIEPYSIPVFVCEESDGLWGSDMSGENAFTTVEGIDPTAADVDGKFQNARQTYSTETAGAADGIIANMDEMWMDVGFEQPPLMSQYFENDSYSKYIIVTSKQGRRAYMNLLRQGQDHFVAGQQDPAYPDPQFHGVPVSWSVDLSTAQLYDNGTTAESEGALTTGNVGPRFYFLNTEYLYPVFHSEMYFQKKEVTKHHNVPDTWVCPVATWYNLICTSRRHQGIISPSTDLYTGLY